MSTIIDSLIIELGIDPKKLTTGQQQAIRQFKKTEEEALASGRRTEDAARKSMDFIGGLQRRVLGFASLVLGGMGLKQLVQHLTTTDAAIGRTSQLLGTSSEILSTWRGIAVRTGGTAEGMTAGVSGLVQQFQNFSLTGQSAVIPYFRALGIQLSDATGRMRPFNAIMLDLADAFSKLDPARAAAFGQALGFDEATISLLVRGRAAVQQLIDEQQRLRTVSAGQASGAQELATAWSSLTEAGLGLADMLLHALNPGLVAGANLLTSWVTSFRGWLGSSNTWVDDLDRSLGGALSYVLGNSRSRMAGKLGGPGIAAPVSASAAAEALRLKGGATGGGGAHVGTMALAQALQASIPELVRFTAINDRYHQFLGRGGHPQGLALDFSIRDPAQSAQVANAVRRRLAEMGVNANVIDEYANPSRGSTGGHIHVGFANAAAAARYHELSSATRAGGGTVDARVTTTNNDTRIENITVNTQATDAEGIARGLRPALAVPFAAQANYGRN